LKPNESPLSAARSRGVERRTELLSLSGESLSLEEAANQLELTPEDLKLRVKERLLIAVEQDGASVFPAWQFSIPNLSSILAALGADDPLIQLSFFLNPLGILDDKTPLEILRENRESQFELILTAARGYGEHGAS